MSDHQQVTNMVQMESRSGNSVRVRPTRVGMGVFAEHPFPPSSVIGEIMGEISRGDHEASNYAFDLGDDLQLEPAAPFRFLNHHGDPNCEFDWYDDEGPGDLQQRRHLYLIALRNIEPLEELTIDYNWPAEHAIVCDCRSAICRGWIVDSDQLHQVSQGRVITSEWFFYLARCADDSIYAGICKNLRDREAKHNEGTGAKYTRSRRPVRIVYSESFPSQSAALRREAQVKRWRRSKKQSLVMSATSEASCVTV